MFKAAIIGCGVISRCHAQAMQKTPSIQLGAVMDVVPERAEAVGKEFGVPSYTNLRSVLRRKDIDFIDICTPSGLHADIAIRAARAGKHCICEKPLDVTPQRCDRIIEAFRKSGTTLGGIFQHRYADGPRKTRDAVRAGRLGRLTLVTCSTPWWRTQDYYNSGDWRGTWRLDGGGALMNQGVHAIDLMLWIAGPIKSVSARTALLSHERIEVEDTAVATVEFESGALGIIQGTTAAYPGAPVRHEFLGNAGNVFLLDDRIDLWKLRDEEGSGAAAAPTPASCVEAAATSSDPAALSGDCHARNIEDIASAVREGRAPCVTPEEGKKAVEVICAVYKSAMTGRNVTLPLKRFAPRKR
jgi:predicted dehydrogenase